MRGTIQAARGGRSCSGAGHLSNPGETIVGVTGVMIRALFYCSPLRLTGSLRRGSDFMRPGTGRSPICMARRKAGM